MSTATVRTVHTLGHFLRHSRRADGRQQSAARAAAAPADDSDGRAHEEIALDAFAETTMAVGSHRLRLLSLPDVPESDRYEIGHDLTGLVRWPVSSLVAGLLQRRGALANDTDVLDVGCGTGVAGIAAAVVCSPRRLVLPTAAALPRAGRENARLQDAVNCAVDVEAYGWGTGDPRPPSAVRLVCSRAVPVHRLRRDAQLREVRRDSTTARRWRALSTF